MFISALVIGCLIGFSFAYMIIGILVCNSNNHGDSKGDFNAFTEQPIHMIDKKNNISPRKIP